MENIQDQLKTIAKSLTGLSRQVEKISRQVVKLSSSPKALQSKRTSRLASTKTKVMKGVATKKTAAKKSKAKITVLDSVLAVIKRSKKGVNIATLRKKTGLGPRQLSNSLYKLSKKGMIAAKSRGIYTVK